MRRVERFLECTAKAGSASEGAVFVAEVLETFVLLGGEVCGNCRVLKKDGVLLKFGGGNLYDMLSLVGEIRRPQVVRGLAFYVASFAQR